MSALTSTRATPSLSLPRQAGEGWGGGMWRRGKAGDGFTLVELVVVIAITGVIAGMVAVFILRPIQGYDAQVRRAELVDAAEGALRRMQREIRRALPNSVRATPEGSGNGKVLEIIPTIDGGRYREEPPGGPITRLNFATADTDFDVFGNLVCTADPTVTGACATYNNPNHWLVIYNLGQPGADAYAGTDVITVGSTLTVTSGGVADHINLNPGFDFAFRSPTQRFFIVTSPISYVCDTAARTLTRYQGHPLTAAQTAVDTNSELSALTAGALMARNVVSCEMEYQAGTTERAGLVIIGLTIQDPDTNENIRLLHQVHVDNVP